jgi:hypothetical protein
MYIRTKIVLLLIYFIAKNCIITLEVFFAILNINLFALNLDYSVQPLRTTKTGFRFDIIFIYKLNNFGRTFLGKNITNKPW